MNDSDSVKSPSNHIPAIKVDVLKIADVNKMLPNSGQLFVAETVGWNDINGNNQHSHDTAYEETAQKKLRVGSTPAIEPQNYIESSIEIFKPTVLVCDDNADMRSYVKHTLSSNFNVIEASNGQEALNIAITLAASEASPMSMKGDDDDTVPRRRIDLVLADVMMPIMDGIELSKNLRANPFTRTLPIIMLTAPAASGNSMNEIFAGADDYLFKPFDAQELIGRVTTHSNLYRMRLEYADARNKIAVLEAANEAKSKLIALGKNVKTITRKVYVI
jgi:CheY-like chemotaxis protein